MARASSGSRSSISSIEPFMSANSAVTVLRSPSMFSRAVLSPCSPLALTRPGTTTLADDTALATSRVPHCLQKLASEGFSAPHFAQRPPKAPPQPTQNFASSGLSRAHLGQRIAVASLLPLARRSRLGLFQPVLQRRKESGPARGVRSPLFRLSAKLIVDGDKEGTVAPRERDHCARGLESKRPR